VVEPDGHRADRVTGEAEEMIKILLLPFIFYATCGLMLSAAVHVISLLGLQPIGKKWFMALHIGIFPLWLPVVIMSQRIAKGTSKRDFWKVALSGCPVWMRYATYGLFVYALVNFAIFFLRLPGKNSRGQEPSNPVLQGFSGHWMAFYSAGLAVLVSAYRYTAAVPRHCVNGHLIKGEPQHCSTCGVRIEGRAM
jgi:hypothetical protein